MTTQVELGKNRTGIATAGNLSIEMVEGTREFPPSSAGDERAIMFARQDYGVSADPLGSVPPPATLKGAVKTVKQAITGNHPTQFIDKIGERIGFERTGVRLYEALLSKFDGSGSFAGGPEREELEQIMMQELEHFRMLQQAARQLGADPTVMSPSADLHATLSRGIVEVLVDARTNFMQGLEAILLAELADNDGWMALLELAENAGEAALATRFREAEMHERDHLARVRNWLAAAQERALGSGRMPASPRP